MEYTKEQINTTIALALMKHLLNEKKISESVYEKIITYYKEKAIDTYQELC